MQSRSTSTQRRLFGVLALAVMSVGVLSPTAAIAQDRTAPHRAQVEVAPAVSWSLISTLSPAYPQGSRSVLVFYGAYAYTPLLVNFSPNILPPSINQSVVPSYAVPDGNPHTYKAVFHLGTNAATSFRLNGGTPVTVGGGKVDVEFIETIQHANWNYWELRNANNDHWLFFGWDLYEQVN